MSRTPVEVQGRTLELSNLDKVFYPTTGTTKGQVIDYYVRISGVLLPHLAGRPLTMVRYPDGVAGGHFYEKRRPPHAPDWVHTAEVPSERARDGVVTHVVCNDLPTLVWLANLASLELHPLLARQPSLQNPTTLMFDLDPGPPAGLLEAGRVALMVRQLLDNLGLPSLIKTSGSKGLHLVLPLDGKSTYDDTRPFAQHVAAALARSHPDQVVAIQRKTDRAGKVLVDWNQNGFTNTTVAAYSLRATAMPQVSTPITWDELDDALAAGDPSSLVFGPEQVLERVARFGDLHKGALKTRRATAARLGSVASA
ncbi:MAG: primase-like protein [Acidimicrobiia bacterium]|nr:primase-like protein [Acidimicrobiia bacterium]